MTATQVNSKVSVNDIAKYRGQLLDWYDKHRRDIPWRAKAGESSDPYHVWLSEIMCQQTTVQAVKAYYLKFLGLWPRVQDLAAAEQDDVMAAWAGLGYYARARNLHKCAKIVANDFGGVFPDTQEELRKLPGIGEYTSAAIAAIAFNKLATVVDGNVERVMARFFAIEEPMPTSKKKLKALAHEFYDGFGTRPGDLAQSFMDLGAGVCIPKAPRCPLCPLQQGCEGHKRGIAADLPSKLKKAERPQRVGNVYWVKNKQGEVLFHRRAEKGLLGGMAGLPTSEWSAKGADKHLDILKDAQLQKTKVTHTFTHFDLKLDVYTASLKGPHPSELSFYWANPDKHAEKLPTVFKKVLKLCKDTKVDR